MKLGDSLMRNRSSYALGEINIRYIVFVLTVLFLALFIGRAIPRLSPSMPILIAAGAAICLITLIRTDLGLIILIFSMLLSPELRIAEVPDRAVVVRVEDILLLVVFFTWLAKTAINKELGLLKRTPLNVPIGIYISVCILSTALGIFVGEVNPANAFFYILKFIEYFMLYFMFVNNITSRRQVQTFIAVFFLTCFIICILGCIQIAGGAYRPTAPFEGAHPEPNTLAGYLLLLAGVVIGLFLYSPSVGGKFLLGTLAFLILFCFIYTLSRSSYVALIPMYLALIIMTRRKRALLIWVLMLTILLSPFITPEVVKERITRTFVTTERYEILGRPVALEGAAAARVYHWRSGFKEWKESPLFGHGITGIEFIDSQYFRVMGELGTIGFIVFAWLLITIFRNGLRTFQTSQDRFTQGLCLGFLAGYVGLLVQAIAVNTFIIVRIMEPFWFLTAIVMRLPQLEPEIVQEGIE